MNYIYPEPILTIVGTTAIGKTSISINSFLKKCDFWNSLIKLFFIKIPGES